MHIVPTQKQFYTCICSLVRTKFRRYTQTLLGGGLLGRITVTYTSILSILFSLIIPLFFWYLLHHVFTSISSFLCPRLTPARLSTFLFVFMFIYIPLLSKNKVREWRTQLVFVTKTNSNIWRPWQGCQMRNPKIRNFNLKIRKIPEFFFWNPEKIRKDFRGTILIA